MNNIKFKIAYLLLKALLCILFNPSAKAQVEHNYLVGPQSTDCDSMDISNTSLKDAIQMIEKATFRFQQQFSISRTHGVMKAKYYSCDGLYGYLIMQVDKSDVVYLKVPKTIWDELIISQDINAFYASRIYRQYHVISQ